MAEQKEQWLNYLAFTTIVLALCATLSTFKGGGFSGKAQMSQAQASDQWAYFQSKSIKQYIFEGEKDKLELELKKGMSAEAAKAYKAKIDECKQKIAKYESEKDEISKKAKELEKVRDEAMKHASALGFAVILLQLAVMISSITTILRRKRLWLIGVGIGVIGALWFLNGIFLIF